MEDTKTEQKSNGGQSSGASCYVSRLNSKDRAEVLGDLGLAREFLDSEYLIESKRDELVKHHIQSAIDLISKLDT